MSKSTPADSRMSDGPRLHPAQPAIVNSNVHFQKEGYDFHLEDTLNMKVLMKKFKLPAARPLRR